MAATSMTAGEFSPMPTFSFLRQLYGETEFSSAVVRDDHDWQLPGSQSYHSKKYTTKQIWCLMALGNALPKINNGKSH